MEMRRRSKTWRFRKLVRRVQYNSFIDKIKKKKKWKRKKRRIKKRAKKLFFRFKKRRKKKKFQIPLDILKALVLFERPDLFGPDGEKRILINPRTGRRKRVADFFDDWIEREFIVHPLKLFRNMLILEFI